MPFDLDENLKSNEATILMVAPFQKKFPGSENTWSLLRVQPLRRHRDNRTGPNLCSISYALIMKTDNNKLFISYKL